MFDSICVEKWVDYIQTLHAREIELSLFRVLSVYEVLFPQGLPFRVISVAGTNGKGSTTEILASIFRASGRKAAKFTSPHIETFNERFCVNGVNVSDEVLLFAFRKVERSRGVVSITYFEYGVLLALVIFEKAEVDVAVLEVGLGGRLDAVNIVDADAAIITSISLDHTDWLGDSLEKIGFEKAGIAREGTPCVIGLRKPQDSINTHLKSIDAEPHILGQEFEWRLGDNNKWSYVSDSLKVDELPLPFGQSGIQLDNASIALRVVELFGEHFPMDQSSIREGLESASIIGRCQVISESPLVVLDVAHNEASVARLSSYIQSLNVTGRLIVVCGMLRDKEIVASFKQIEAIVDQWHLASISENRGATAGHLKDCLHETCGSLSLGSVTLYDNVTLAYGSALSEMTKNDCLVVFGSFYIASDIIKFLRALPQ